MPEKTINLIRASSGGVISMNPYGELMKKVSTWIVVALLVSGVVVGVAYAYLTMRSGQLAIEKQSLSATIAADATIEGLLLTIHQRIAAIQKIQGVSRPVANLLSLLSDFATPDEIASVSLDNNGKASVAMHVTSVAAAQQIVTGIMKDTGTRLRSPQLTSLSLGADGDINLAVSFTPVL